MHVVKIGPKLVVRDGAPVVMAEVGVNHDGRVEKGMKLVEAAAAATCDAVKFQLFRAELLLAREAGLVDYQKDSGEESAAGMLKKLEMGVGEMTGLVRRAQTLGMAAVVTPFSVELVGACVEMGVDAIKLASPDLLNRPLMEEAARTGLPLIVSTGAAELAEVERAVGWLWKIGARERTILLHCVSSYPTAPERATLGAVGVLRQRFVELPIGYSDHTVESFTAALAVAGGACFLEKHLTLDRTAAGPDHAASLEPAQMAEYCALAKIGYVMRGAYAKNVQEIEKGVREQTRQSVVAVSALVAGTVIGREMVTVKRPGTGVPAAEMEKVIGKKLVRDVAGNSVIAWEDLES